MPRIVQRTEKQSVISVRTALNDFLASADVKRLLPKTQDEYRYQIGQFADWCGTYSLVQSQKDSSWSVVKVREKYPPVTLHRVNAQAVHLFLEHLRETHKPSKNGKEELSTHTLASYVKDIKRFLNWCVEDELYCEHVQANTVRRIKKPAIEETVIEVFTERDIEALFDACHRETSEHLQMRDTAILSLLLDSGLRATELCTLTLEHVHLETGDTYAKVKGKGHKWGEVGFGEKTRRAVAKYIRQFREPTIEYALEEQLKRLSPRQAQQLKKQARAEARLFVNRAGNPLTKSGLDQLFERLGRWAGVEGVRCSPHTCRHWYALNYILQGGDIYTLSKLLRHSSVKVTEEYLKALKVAHVRRMAHSVMDRR